MTYQDQDQDQDQDQNQNQDTMSTVRRSTIRRYLLTHNVPTRNMSDAQMIQAHAQKLQDNARAKAASKQPTPTPTPTPTTALSSFDIAVRDSIRSQPDLLSHNNDNERIIALIKLHAYKSSTLDITLHTTNSTKSTSIATTTIDTPHPALQDTLTALTLNINVYLVGPSGAGKTTMAQQIAQILKTEYYTVGAVSDKYELMGFVDAGGKYHTTPFRQAIEHGGVFLWDEIDASLPAALNYFNAALENGVITFPDNVTLTIDKSKTFFICGANTVGTGATRTYVGRYELDRAFLDRFMQINVEYDAQIEQQMAISAWVRAGGDMTDLSIPKTWLQTVKKLRDSLDKQRILALITPRATRRGAALLAKGWTVEKTSETELYRHLSTDQRKQLGV